MPVVVKRHPVAVSERATKRAPPVATHGALAGPAHPILGTMVNPDLWLPRVKLPTGRPRLLPERKRSRRLSVAVTARELTALQHYASNHHCSMSRVVQRCLKLLLDADRKETP